MLLYLGSLLEATRKDWLRRISISCGSGGMHASYSSTKLNIGPPKPNPPKQKQKAKTNPNFANPPEFDFTDSWSKFTKTTRGKAFTSTVSNYVSLVTLPISFTSTAVIKGFSLINLLSTADDVAGGTSGNSFSENHIDNEAVLLTINTVKLVGILGGNTNSFLKLGKKVESTTELANRTLDMWKLITSPVPAAGTIKKMNDNMNNLINQSNSSNTDNSSNSNSSTNSDNSNSNNSSSSNSSNNENTQTNNGG